MRLQRRLRYRSRLWIGAVLFLQLSSIPLALTAQERGGNRDEEQRRKAEELRDYIRAHYTKSEHMAPMRDGTRLFVLIYAPKDALQKYPIWMMRTPYTVGPYGADNYRRNLGPSSLTVTVLK